VRNERWPKSAADSIGIMAAVSPKRYLADLAPRKAE
jgi:hypothetical protein